MGFVDIGKSWCWPGSRIGGSGSRSALTGVGALKRLGHGGEMGSRLYHSDKGEVVDRGRVDNLGMGRLTRVYELRLCADLRHCGAEGGQTGTGTEGGRRRC